MFDPLIQVINTFAEQQLGNPVLAIPIYIAAGLASSLFPCVYPLIPVTVGFIRNRTHEGQSKFFHPLLYWAGTILAYTLLGLAAALGGGAFNVWIQNGFVILGMGFLFLFLSFATMDWFPLNFTAGDRLLHRAAASRGFAFTILMGLIAGFVASACVAPALVTMLLFIAKHAAAANGGHYILNVMYGGTLSLCFGIGIGVPFFLAGVLGAKIPASGRWMQIIKYIFAALIALYALQELQKGFAVLGLDAMQIYMILGGLVLAFLAVLLGLRPPESQDLPARTKFYFAILAVAFAFALIVRGVQPQAGPFDGAKTNSDAGMDPSKNFEMIGNLKFYRDHAYAHQLAAQSGKAIFIDFYADWCTNCKDFHELTQKNRRLNAALQSTILLKIYDTDPVFDEYANKDQHKELTIGLPYFLVLKSNGNFHWESQQYRDTEGMLKAIQSATIAGN